MPGAPPTPDTASHQPTACWLTGREIRMCQAWDVLAAQQSHVVGSHNYSGPHVCLSACWPLVACLWKSSSSLSKAAKARLLLAAAADSSGLTAAGARLKGLAATCLSRPAACTLQVGKLHVTPWHGLLHDIKIGLGMQHSPSGWCPERRGLGSHSHWSNGWSQFCNTVSGTAAVMPMPWQA